MIGKSLATMTMLLALQGCAPTAPPASPTVPTEDTSPDTDVPTTVDSGSTDSSGGSGGPPKSEACAGEVLDEITGDYWYGVDNVLVNGGDFVTFCAFNPKQADILKFSTYEVSDGQCGRLQLHVRQLIKGGYQQSSGFTSSPGLTWLDFPDPTVTAPGWYEMVLEGGPASPGCTVFNVAWKAY